MNPSYQTPQLTYRELNLHLKQNKIQFFHADEDFENMNLQDDPINGEFSSVILKKLFDETYFDSCPELSFQLRSLTIQDFFNVLATQSTNQNYELLYGIFSSTILPEGRLIIGVMLDEISFYINSLESAIAFNNDEDGDLEMFDVDNQTALDKLHKVEQILMNEYLKGRNLLDGVHNPDERTAPPLTTTLELKQNSEEKFKKNFVLPSWLGSPTEFIEMVSVGLHLDKFGGMNKYRALDKLIEAFNIPIDSNEKINAQRLHKLKVRKKSSHPLIDQYVKVVAENKKITEESRKFKKRMKNLPDFNKMSLAKPI